MCPGADNVIRDYEYPNFDNAAPLCIIGAPHPSS